MEQSRVSGRGWALLFARLVLGLIFFMAGFWKVFQLGPLPHARKYFLPLDPTELSAGHFRYRSGFCNERLSLTVRKPSART
jgi:uncharacterized membrane protein YphA (DoxX/SURF4 family)